MAPVDGRNEVLDSEDEPMTSSPVAVSDGTVDKLFAIAQVPPQDTQDALREAARPHQATTWTVANVTAQRTDGLDADQSIASIDIDASMDEGADIKPTTTATSSKPMGSNNATNDLLPDVATRTTSETGDTRPQQHATMAHFTQNKEHVPASAKTAGAETMTAPTVQQTSEAAGDAVRDEVTTPEQQPETVDNKVAPECANEQSSHRSSNESKNIVEPEEESVPQHVEADLPQYDLNEDGEVSKLHSNEQSALREEANTLVTSQHDTPLLPVPLPSTDRTTSIKSKDAQHVDETTRPMQQDVIQRLRREVSSSGFDTKHRVCLLLTCIGISSTYKLRRLSPRMCMTTPMTLLLDFSRDLKARARESAGEKKHNKTHRCRRPSLLEPMLKATGVQSQLTTIRSGTKRSNPPRV